MAKLFEFERVVPAWLEATKSLALESSRTARNYVLEIKSPSSLRPADLAVISAVDNVLRATGDGIGVYTVAATIFPQRLYARHGCPAFYDKYLALMKKGQKPHTWGTYAMRLMSRPHPKKAESINPLDTIVQKFRRSRTGTRKITSAYELGVHEPSDLVDGEVAGELAIYAPSSDGGLDTNIPCLSHLTFKLNPARDAVDLTAIYRSHYYGRRALGNLIGLSQLQSFVAAESGYAVGQLTCVSTLAKLDVEAFGGVGRTNALLASLGAPPP